MKNKIVMGFVLLGILVITIMPASALPRNFDGDIFFSNGTACTNIDKVEVTNSNNGKVWNQTTSPTSVIIVPGYSSYLLTIDDPLDIVSGNTLQYFAQCGTETNTSTRSYSGSAFTHDIHLNAPAGQPDLTPTAVWDNPGKGAYLFANEPNDIKVNINNSGSADAGSFDVTLEIDSYTETKNVASLAAGANINVTFTGYAPTTTGAKTVNITADKVNAIAEINEVNNLLSTSRIVYNNGYKGKRWTGGADIATVETYNIKGNVNYSTGTSAFTGGNWTSISASWSSADLPIPSTATVLSAKLYVYYNWNRTYDYPLWGDNTTFNGITYPKSGASHYSDVKGWGPISYSGAADKTYGTLVYNVTSNFNKSGNTASLGNGVSARDVAVDGMILQVVYSDANEPQRMIWINEGYDLFLVGTTYGTDPNETIAYAPFTGGASINLANVASARLIAVGLGVTNTTGGKNNVIFNSNNHLDALPDSNSKPPGIANINVTSELGTSNTAAIQDNGDSGGMRAATTILVVEQKPGMRIDLGGPYDTEVGRHIMVPITANQFTKFYGTVQMNFSYESSTFNFVAVHSNPQSTVTAYNNNAGILSISAWNTVGVKGDVVLATVELEVKAGQGTNPALNLAVNLLQDIYGATIDQYTVPATVRISNPVGNLTVDSATSTPISSMGNNLSAILNENGRPRHTGDNETVITAHVTDPGVGINSVTVNLSAIGGSAAALMSGPYPNSGDYTVNAKATTGINGTYPFVVTATDTGGNTASRYTNSLTIYRRGDVVRNNLVNMGDALYIARYTVGLETPNMDLFNFVGDLMPASDSDYTVNMGDALYIARHSVGLEPAP